MLVESYSLLPQNSTFCEVLFASLLIFVSIATCMKRAKKKPDPQESVILGTTIDTRIDSIKLQSLQNMLVEKQDEKPSSPSNAPDAKPSVEKTLLIEFDRGNIQPSKSSKSEKKATEDNQKFEINNTQVVSLKSSIKSEKTQELSKQINNAKLKSAESSKIQSSGKSEESQKDELKAGKQIPETDSHATSKLDESSNKETSLIRKT
ncbi:hypothetical protein ACH3XW_17165 [Acanthocheilonema viteae]